MTFIEPFLLWGALATAIPIAIHFWYQKRGKPLPWAATQWLVERNQQQSRGLRLDNVLLLLLRCLLLILLAVLLAQPMLDWLDKVKAVQKIHLVQNDPLVTGNFRFELEQARRKGERIVLAWSGIPASAAGQVVSAAEAASTLSLQTAISRLPSENTELHLYIINNQSLADVPTITVPPRFKLHALVDSVGKPRPYLALNGIKRLSIDRSGKLVTTALPGPTAQFRPNPAHSGPIRILLDYRSVAERQTIRAALGALSDVYDLPLSIEENKVSGTRYDWVLTDQPYSASEPVGNPRTLYTVSQNERTPITDNVVFTAETLTPQTSERVANGQLPEWLGEQLIRHYGLAQSQLPLGQRALNALFVPTRKTAVTQQAGLQNVLTLLFLVLLLLERWIALTKNA